MRILHFVGGLEKGGIESFVAQLAHAQSEEYDHCVGVGCLLRRSGAWESWLAARNIPIFGPKRSVPTNQLGVARITWAAVRTFEPDIVHLHVNWSLIWQVWGLHLAGFKGMVVMTQHSTFDLHGWNRRRYRFLSRIAARRIDRFSGVSSYASCFCYEMTGGKGRRPHVLYPGIRESDFEFDGGCRERFRSDNRVDKSTVVFGSVGHFTANKGLDVLVKAFAQHRQETDQDSRLMILGSGGSTAAAREQISELSIAPHVTLVDPAADVCEFLCGLDIYVQPSRKETFGLAVLEALASGLAIVASDVGGLREIAELEPSISLVPSEDAQRLSEVMAEVQSGFRVSGFERRSRLPPSLTFESAVHRVDRFYDLAS
jgi:glycosyltransferase involved in cell wall biosynthesis